MTHICIVSPNSYSLFNSRYNFLHGGAELRSWLLGNRLSVEPDYNITFIVLDHGQKTEEMYNNVRVVAHSYHRGPSINKNPNIWDINLKYSGKAIRNSFNRNKSKVMKEIDSFFDKKPFLQQIKRGFSWLNTSGSSINQGEHYICPQAWEVYSAVDADIYCIFGNTNLSYEVAMFCKTYNKKFILFSASDIDFSEKYRIDTKEKDRYGTLCNLCYYTIDSADLIVCQTQYQKEILHDNFNKEGFVISNPISLTNYVEIPSNRPFALWIGKSDYTKQPQVVLEIARACPDIPFLIIMNPSNPDLHKEICRNKSSNITIIEHVPYSEIESYFAKSFIFINTSQFEGFPNTFLQAGKYCVPIFSLQVDPDNFIEKYNCGIVGKGDLSKLINGLKNLHNEEWKIYSHNIHDYVVKNHNLDVQIKRLIPAIKGIL